MILPKLLQQDKWKGGAVSQQTYVYLTPNPQVS